MEKPFFPDAFGGLASVPPPTGVEGRAMKNLKELYRFNCPHCLVPQTLTVLYADGQKQRFTVRCRMCHKVIDIRIELGPDGVSDFQATKSN